MSLEPLRAHSGFESRKGQRTEPEGKNGKHGPHVFTRRDSVDLGDFLEAEVLPRLKPEDVFTHESHHWHKDIGKWRGGCPWHESKSGTSFNVTLSNLSWYCPTCCVGGGPLQYRWKLRNGVNAGSPRGQDFMDALKELAGLAGVPFPELQLSEEALERSRLRELRRAALHSVIGQCQSLLWSHAGTPARQYLVSRGFGDDACRDLGLGLYPPCKELHAALVQKGFAREDLRAAGVVFPRMEGYVVFPWLDDWGAPLTLYGRWPGSLPEGKPKTMALANPRGENGADWERTKASPLYLDRALKAGHLDLLLVEGITDAALPQVLGDARVIACVAAQLSMGQVETLRRRQVRSVTICLDPDSAGDNGILSCVRSLRDAGITPYVADRLPDGQDPDEFILARGIDTWKEHTAPRVHGYRHQARVLVAAQGERQPGDDSWGDAVVAAAVDFAKGLPPDRADELHRHFWPVIIEVTGAAVEDLETRAKSGGKSHEGKGREGDKAVGETVSRPRLVTLASVKPAKVDYVWKPWLPRGTITVLDGDPGLGKSTVSLDLAARASRGWSMPPGECKVVREPADVLLLGAEDDLANTVRPRLDAAGADVSRVHSLEAVQVGEGEERPPVLPWDLALVESMIVERLVELLVVDPFVAFLDAELDAHRDQDVRRCMHRLKQLAERTRVAILLLRHLNKLNAGPALYRGGGSIGITGAGRSALVVGKHPTEPGHRVLAPVKVNQAANPKSLVYTIEPAGDVSRIGWVGECELAADDILGHAGIRQKEGDRCAEAIREYLGAGTKKVEELEQYLKFGCGFTDNAIRAGRRAAGVKATRVGFGPDGEWMASLPGKDFGEPPFSP
jgi:hypothetical protein